MTIWHQVWFGPGTGFISRLLSRLWKKRGEDGKKALHTANRFLRVFTSVFMLLVAIVCFILLQSLVVW